MISNALGDFFMNNLIEKLKNGDFSNLKINVWFLNYEFDYIMALVEGCDKVVNRDVLNLVVLYANYLLNCSNFNISEEKMKEFLKKNVIHFNNLISGEDLVKTGSSIIKMKCEQILEKVIVVGLKHHEYYGIISGFSTHPNEMLRIFYCANGNFSTFFNDSSKRVRKVCQIREDFINKWQTISEDEKANITFLERAFSFGAIEAFEVGIPPSDDKVNVIFKSLLFNEERVLEFDWDILYAIQDKRILASKLYEIINEKEISLKEDMLPVTFQNILIRK